MNIDCTREGSLLRRYGIAVPDGRACFTIKEAVTAAEGRGFPCVAFS